MSDDERFLDINDLPPIGSPVRIETHADPPVELDAKITGVAEPERVILGDNEHDETFLYDPASGRLDVRRADTEDMAGKDYQQVGTADVFVRD